MRRVFLFTLIAALLSVAPAAVARPEWKLRIDRLVGGKAIGVAVTDDGRPIYMHASKKRRVPASNQKLLLSMVLLDRFGPDATFETGVNSVPIVDGVVEGNLWLYGRGDPSLTASIDYARALPFRETRISWLVNQLRDAGLKRVTGSVVGHLGFFAHDWYARGWKSDFPRRYIPLPTALSLNGNAHEGAHISDPELRAARALTRKLEERGIKVVGKPTTGWMPAGLDRGASVRSVPLSVLMQYMNRQSSNFFAEVFGKALAVKSDGPPGTIAAGASAVRAWARRSGVTIEAFDASGLSYANRISPKGMVKLLASVEQEPWVADLMLGLPSGGQGTLEDRLHGVDVLAKTGTLENISALSGWVWLERRDTWAEFSVLSRGMSKSTASEIEDRIVHILERRGA